MRLLGKSYTLEDAAFYGAGVLAAMAAGVSPATAKVRAGERGLGRRGRCEGKQVAAMAAGGGCLTWEEVA